MARSTIGRMFTLQQTKLSLHFFSSSCYFLCFFLLIQFYETSFIHNFRSLNLNWLLVLKMKIFTFILMRYRWRRIHIIVFIDLIFLLKSKSRICSALLWWITATELLWLHIGPKSFKLINLLLTFIDLL